MNEIIGKYERYPFPFNSKLGLEVSKNMPKIYVKELKKTKPKQKKKQVKNNLSSEMCHFSNTSTGCRYQEQLTHNVTLQNLWFQPLQRTWF